MQHFHIAEWQIDELMNRKKGTRGGPFLCMVRDVPVCYNDRQVLVEEEVREDSTRYVVYGYVRRGRYKKKKVVDGQAGYYSEYDPIPPADEQAIEELLHRGPVRHPVQFDRQDAEK